MRAARAAAVALAAPAANRSPEPSYLGRTEAACTVRSSANCANKKKPSEYLRSQVVIDTMVFSEEGLRHLVAEVGVSQIAYGTDVPFNWPVTVDLVLGAPFLSDADKTAILAAISRGWFDSERIECPW